MSIKVYVADKVNTKEMPHVIADGQDMTDECGLGYYEDEVGWYYIQGELECTND
jgi:hypothetical protein